MTLTTTQLITYFIQLYNLTENDLENEQIDNKRYFKNNTINENWKSFHQKNAILQLIHTKVNSQFSSGTSLINMINTSYSELEPKPWI